MLKLDPATWKWDFAKFPASAQSAFLAGPPVSEVRRLTADLYLFRPRSGSGPHFLVSGAELLEHLQALPIPDPYQPPKPIRQSEPDFDPLDLSTLIADLDKTDPLW